MKPFHDLGVGAAVRMALRHKSENEFIFCAALCMSQTPAFALPKLMLLRFALRSQYLAKLCTSLPQANVSCFETKKEHYHLSSLPN